MNPAKPDLHPAEAAERQRALLLRVVRVTYLILMVTFAALAVIQAASDPLASDVAWRWWMPIIVGTLLVGAGLAADLLVPAKRVSTVIGVLTGMFAGLLATAAVSVLVDLLLQSWVPESEALKVLKPAISSIKILVGLTLCFLGVVTVLSTKDDFRLVIPYVEFSKQLRGVRPILIDTSVLIDGRIVDVASTGFLQAPLVIPRFVIHELQLLADSGDAMVRAKGRRGLEIVTKLQRSPKLDVTLDETGVPGKAVDQMIVELAKAMPAIILTADLALARVATIQNIGVLNLNDLSNALKSALVPGELVTVRLIRQGEQAGQGVGYLADGTMIVAEDGAAHVGQTVSLTVTGALQTSAGRLIFARLTEPGEPPPAAKPEPPQHGPAGLPTDSSPNPPSADTPSADNPHQGVANGTPQDAVRKSPFPPKAPASIRQGSPRNPRR